MKRRKALLCNDRDIITKELRLVRNRMVFTPLISSGGDKSINQNGLLGDAIQTPLIRAEKLLMKLDIVRANCLTN